VALLPVLGLVGCELLTMLLNRKAYQHKC